MLDLGVLASNIKKQRKICGITQNELAKQLFVSPQSISKWECGNALPELSKLCLMADIFNVTVDSLIGSDGCSGGRSFIAVDGGGTKTEFVLFEDSGRILSRLVLEGANPTSCGVEGTCQILERGIDELMQHSRGVAGIYAGISGAGVGDFAVRISDFLKERFPRQASSCNTDILNVVAGALDLSVKSYECVAVICGTGSVAYACRGTSLQRVGGWGYLLDNAGSGYDFGREALCAALAERDGMGEKTLITPMAEAKIGGRVWDNIEKIYSGGRSYIASYAPIVFDAYSRGDAVAAQIIDTGTDRLAHMIECARRDMSEAAPVVISGGLMAYADTLINIIKSKISRHTEFIVPSHPQIYGAAVLCGEMCGVEGAAFREKFNSDYKKMISKGDKLKC